MSARYDPATQNSLNTTGNPADTCQRGGAIPPTKSKDLTTTTTEAIGMLEPKSPSRAKQGVLKVGVIGGVITIFMVVSLPFVSRIDPLPTPRQISIPWLAMAALYYIAELSVVHFRFRRDAHSFSISEVITVVGLYFASPLAVIGGQVAGAVVALALNRHQRGVRLFFNLACFALQTLIVVAVFHLVVEASDPLAISAMVAALAGSLLALATATALITTAIRLSGGSVTFPELAEVFLFGCVGILMNVGLGLVAVTIVWERPQAVWLALLPIALMFVAFQAYTNQRDERARIEMLYDLTFALHSSPVLDDALKVAAEGARNLFEASAAHIILIPEPGKPYALRSSAVHDQPTDVMTPISLLANGRWPSVLHRSSLLPKLGPHDLPIPGMPSPSSAMCVPIASADRQAGVLVVGDPLSAIGGFTPRDLRLAETIASRLMVSLENGRLEDSLIELTNLKDRLEALIRSKDQFLASISHELRTPLTGIVGLAQELKRDHDLPPEEIDEFLGMIYEESTELANIVEDLLVAARADIGTLVIRPNLTDVVAVTKPVLANYARKTGTTRIDPEPRGLAMATAYFDTLRFRQVIRNLITNALRYGGDSIWVETSENQEHVLLAVVDDGEGVPTDSIDDIFEPYTRASNSLLNPQSVGLGLSVSRQLARLMGGDLIYERHDGQARFVILLPKQG